MTTVNMDTLEKTAQTLSALTIMEAVKLVEMLEKEWGISASATMMAAPAASAQEAQVEQTAFAIHLKSAGNQKIAVIKAVREITGLALTEAKAVVDALKVVKEGVSKSDADEIAKKLTEAGAEVEIK